jgi:hypothetical protein
VSGEFVSGHACGEIDEKRFFIPGLKLTGTCPTCSATVEVDFSDAYLTYPSIGEPIRFGMRHAVENDEGYDDEHEWIVMLHLDISLTVLPPKPPGQGAMFTNGMCGVWIPARIAPIVGGQAERRASFLSERGRVCHLDVNHDGECDPDRDEEPRCGAQHPEDARVKCLLLGGHRDAAVNTVHWCAGLEWR